MNHPAPLAANDPQLIGPAVVPCPRWVRVKFGGLAVANSKRALLLRQYGRTGLPTYFFPQDDVRMDLLEPAVDSQSPPTLRVWTVKVGDHVANAAAWTYQQPPADRAALTNYITFAWSKMEAWYEEEEEIFVHARDPYKRVDVLQSSRHIRVVLAGETVAETRQPSLLFETHLPTRYYLPPEDVRREILVPSPTASRCPYKGLATYWSVQIGEQQHRDIVWSYLEPIAECPKIKGLLCFFNERVDLYVDGEHQPRPRTPWSES